MVINAKELQKEQKQKHDFNRNIYKQLLEDCSTKIQSQNKLGNVSIVLRIPYMKMGLPGYNITHAKMYIIRKLKEAGYIIHNVHENCIHIAWNKVNEVKEEKQPQSKPKGILRKKI